MKKFFCILFALIAPFAVWSQNDKMSIMVDHHSYATDKMEPYVEFAFYFGAKSLRYVPNDLGKYVAEVKVELEILQNDSVINNLRFIVVSDSYNDTLLDNKLDFSEIQYLKISNGQYFLHYKFTDLHNPASQVEYNDMITVNFPENQLSTSEILLLSDIKPANQGDFFIKYDYSITPLFYSFAPQSVPLLYFITEIYNSDLVFGKNNEFNVRTYIETLDGKSMLLPNAVMEKNFSSNPVVVLMHQLPIVTLPSDNYNLVITIYKGDSLYYRRKAFFQRSNPGIKLNINDYTKTEVTNTFVDKLSQDTAQFYEYVHSLYPIGTPMERDFFTTRLSKIPYEQLRRFFYHFWVTRAPENPELGWFEYNEKVKHVEELYGSKQLKGYRSDRGRVFLQYGPPNSIYESPYDSHSYPYEIWHYYTLSDQNNVKFIFYNTDLVSNDFELLHSDKYGEVYDASWQTKLTFRRTTPTYNFDVKEGEDYWGDHTKEDWKYNK